MISGITNRFKLRKFQKVWRTNNTHNSSEAMCVFDLNKVSVGNYTYGEIYVRDYYYDNEKLEIGHFCSIASGVKFFLAGNHFMDRPTTFPVNKLCEGTRGKDGYSKGPIIVGSDVWIGYDTWIFSGVNIGQGAVIGARSLIAKDVPPYSIVAGNPAKIIRYRFSQEIIQELLKIDYSRVTKEHCTKYLSFLTKPLEIEDLKEFLSELSCGQ